MISSAAANSVGVGQSGLMDEHKHTRNDTVTGDFEGRLDGRCVAVQLTEG